MKSFLKLFCNKQKNALLFISGSIFVILAAVSGLALGSCSLSLSEVISALFSGADGINGRIVFYVRLPRTCACIVCGAALAVSGGIIQGVLSNRLASPGIIGVNSGAGLAVTLCTVFGIYGGIEYSVFAFLGALLCVAVIGIGAKKWGASRSTVILMGVALSSLLNAITHTVVTLNPDAGVMSNDFKIGDFSAVTYQRLIPSAVLIFLTLFVLFLMTNELDVLCLGEENAAGLGLNTRVMRPFFLILAALLSGCAVSLAGLLSFVGLIVPNLIRRITGSASRLLLPLSALFGAGFVTVCDTLARTLFAPYEIPVGIIMAFLGVPFFIFILINKREGE